ncbi:MAG: lipid-A-disaccharide synthase [Synergistaceae bacterium]|nr:lipid-A-disaccharide synthase [Synergistaceae bacterium]
MKNTLPSFFVSCGEVSGDLYAADLITELRNDSSEIWGMMGPRGVTAGGAAVWSYEELKLMGFTEIVPAIPRVLKLRNSIVREVMSRNPDAVVVVDSPDFHFSLVGKLRAAGYKGLTVFLATPSVWAWRSGRTKLLRDYFDLCFPLFSFEHDFLIKREVNSRWTAHPLAVPLAGYSPPPELAARYGGGRVIALMPGSRRYDIKNHLPQLIETAKLLKSEQFIPVFSVAPGLSEPLRAELAERAAGFERWDGDGCALMAVSEAAVGVSGTVSVEAMLLRRFMVVIYNGRGLSWLLARLLVRIPYISIPNYLTDEPIYPELLKDDANPERITRELHAYLDDPAKKAKADRLMDAAQNAMGTTKAAPFWARSILDMLPQKQAGYR